MTGRHLTVKELILVHLAPLARFAEEYECPETMSQAGISKAIGKSRAHTTIELNRMKEDGLVSEKLAHVKGARSKRKTYSLTPRAMTMESRIMEHVRSSEITLEGEVGKETVDGGDAIEVLVNKFSLSRASAADTILSSGGKLNLKAVEEGLASKDDPETTETDAHEAPAILPQEDQSFDSLLLRAKALSKEGRQNEALAFVEKAIGTGAAVHDLWGAHYTMASILRKLGNFPAALASINTSLELAEESGKRLGIARCKMEKAMVLSGMGNESQSLDLLDSAEMVFRQEDSQVDLLRCGINQGMVLRNLGKTEEAIDVLDVSLDLAERTGLDRLRAYAMVNLTDLLNEKGDYGRSVEMATKAKDTFLVLNEPLMLAASHFNLGTALAGLGEKGAAMANLDEAIAILQRNGMLTSRTAWLKHYATLLEEMGEKQKAIDIMNKI